MCVPPGKLDCLVTRQHSTSACQAAQVVCPVHGEKRMDRVRKVRDFFHGHARCRSAPGLVKYF